MTSTAFKQTFRCLRTTDPVQEPSGAFVELDESSSDAGLGRRNAIGELGICVVAAFDVDGTTNDGDKVPPVRATSPAGNRYDIRTEHNRDCGTDGAVPRTTATATAI